MIHGLPPQESPKRDLVVESLESDSMENEVLDERERPQQDGKSTTSSQGEEDVLRNSYNTLKWS